MDDLRMRLEEDDAYFTELIDLIPVCHFFEQSVKRKITEEKHNVTNKKLKGSKRKQKLSKKGKHKLARLDPHQQKSISQVQLELEEEKKPQKKTKLLPATTSRTNNLQELQERLKSNINVLSGKRKNAENESSEEKQKVKKLKKKETFKKLKVNSNKEQSKALPRNKKTKPVVKPLFNKENKILYSKFNVAESGTQITKLEHTGKKPEKLLLKIKNEKEKEQALEAVAPNKAKAIKEKAAWKKAIDRAEGLKVKDNPELLKQSIKKRKQQKQHSQKKWKERKDVTKKRQERRQQKRNSNILAKKKEKRNKKIKKAKKKGRIF